jgi:hypothetical protein
MPGNDGLMAFAHTPGEIAKPYRGKLQRSR